MEQKILQKQKRYIIVILAEMALTCNSRLECKKKMPL